MALLRQTPLMCCSLETLALNFLIYLFERLNQSIGLRLLLDLTDWPVSRYRSEIFFFRLKWAARASTGIYQAEESRVCKGHCHHPHLHHPLRLHHHHHVSIWSFRGWQQWKHEATLTSWIIVELSGIGLYYTDWVVFTSTILSGYDVMAFFISR